MRDLAWRYFESTGEIDAYLLYKEHQKVCGDGQNETACALENTGDSADD
ncbi:MAG TPA: YqzL family protein [Bacilli bacterium]|nr:YqzL family protein [Bacilli bacterium]